MLYLDAETLLQDCNDLDDNSSVASCDLVQDYKKQNRLYAKKSKISLVTNGGTTTTLNGGFSATSYNGASTTTNNGQANGGLIVNGQQQNGSMSAGTRIMIGIIIRFKKRLKSFKFIIVVAPPPSIFSTSTNGQSNSLFFNDRLYSSTSTESVCSLVSDNDECEWKLISISKNSGWSFC